MSLAFEWDLSKANANLKKHRVSFEEASTVFGDPLSITIPDPERSRGERRYITIGLSGPGRVLVVAHVDRGRDKIRLISARRATRTEARAYQEG